MSIFETNAHLQVRDAQDFGLCSEANIADLLTFDEARRIALTEEAPAEGG